MIADLELTFNTSVYENDVDGLLKEATKDDSLGNIKVNQVVVGRTISEFCHLHLYLWLLCNKTKNKKQKKNSPCKKAAFYVKEAAFLQVYNCNKLLFYKQIIVKRLLFYKIYIFIFVRMLPFYLKNCIFITVTSVTLVSSRENKENDYRDRGLDMCS